MIITFAGHSLISSYTKVKETVKENIRKNIVDADCVTCYIGGYGDFDGICARACKELNEEHCNIEIVYVTPYISLSEQEKIKTMKKNGLCDISIYPPIESIPPRLAILKRNEWMITNADLVIVYVAHNYGGAYKSLQMAKRRKKKIINIYHFL